MTNNIEKRNLRRFAMPSIVKALACLVIVLCLAPASLLGQVSMPSSPVSGNGADLNFVWSAFPNPGQITFVISPIAGQLQGSCYITVNSYYGGFGVWLYETSSGTPENPQFGNVGWQSSLSSSDCSIDLGASSLNRYNGVGLSLHVTIDPLRIGTRQITASYSILYCDDYSSYYNCAWDDVSDTVGSWNSAPNAGPSAILTTPTPGSLLAGRSIQFIWTPVANATQYCMDLGSAPSASDIYSGCSPTLSLTPFNVLPTTGIPVNVTITATGPSMSPAISQFTLKALDYSVPASVAIPTSRFLSGTSITVGLSPGTNVVATKVNVTSDTAGFVGQYNYGSFNVPIPLGTNTLYVTATSTFVNGTTAVRSAAFTTGQVLADPVITVSGTTVSWPSRYASTQHYLTVGKSPGSILVYPGGSTDYTTRGVAFTDNQPAGGTISRQIPNLGIYQDGCPLWMTLYYWDDPAAEGTKWLVQSVPIQTSGTTCSVSAPAVEPSAIITGTDPFIRSLRMVFDDAFGLQRWLTAGTTYRGSDLYNSYNGRLPDALTQGFADIAAVPDNLSTLYLTLYTKTGSDWVGVDYQHQMVPAAQLQTLQTAIIPPSGSFGGGSLFDCVNSPGNDPIVCILPAGVFGIGDSPADPAAAQFMSSEIKISRSNVTIAGAGTPGTLPTEKGDFISNTATRLIRMTAAPLPSDCKALIKISGSDVNFNPQNITIRNLTIDGNNPSFADFCTAPNPQPQDPDRLNQPDTTDIEVSGYLTSGSSQISSPSSVYIDNILFLNGLSRSLSVVGTGVSDVHVTNSNFSNAALTGIIVSPTSPEFGYCDNGWDWANDPNIAKNIEFRHNFFHDSWTGATAFNGGAHLTIDNSLFLNNYWHPYDASGGTSFTDRCVKDAIFTNSIFDGSSLSTLTQAIETHSVGITITGNTIRGYPQQGIFIRESQNVTIQSNTVLDNGRIGPKSGGVTINAVGGLIKASTGTYFPPRDTQNLTFISNTIDNSAGNVNPTQQVAVRLMACNGGCSSVLGPIIFIGGINGGGVVNGNDFTNNTNKRYSGDNAKVCKDAIDNPIVLTLLPNNSPPFSLETCGQ